MNHLRIACRLTQRLEPNETIQRSRFGKSTLLRELIQMNRSSQKNRVKLHLAWSAAELLQPRSQQTIFHDALPVCSPDESERRHCPACGRRPTVNVKPTQKPRRLTYLEPELFRGTENRGSNNKRFVSHTLCDTVLARRGYFTRVRTVGRVSTLSDRNVNAAVLLVKDILCSQSILTPSGDIVVLIPKRVQLITSVINHSTTIFLKVFVEQTPRIS